MAASVALFYQSVLMSGNKGVWNTDETMRAKENLSYVKKILP
jgi:hypothetical protein